MNTISEFLRRHPRIFLMSDEIYEFLISPNQVHHSFAKIAPDLKNRIFTVNGFAKAWAMTGLEDWIPNRKYRRNKESNCFTKSKYKQCMQFCSKRSYCRTSGLKRLRS